MGTVKQKSVFKHVQKVQIHLILHMGNVLLRHFSPLKHSLVSNDPVCKLQRPWSDCMDAQADLGLCCPHIPQDTFSHGAAHMAMFPGNLKQLSQVQQEIITSFFQTSNNVK